MTPSLSPSTDPKRGPVPGLEDVPVAYRSPRAEREALETAAVADLSVHGVLELRGPDVAGFLEDVVAGPVGGAEPGEAVPTLLLDTDGKVEAAAVAWFHGDDAADLLVQAPGAEAAAETLSQYTPLVDVDVGGAPKATLLHVTGAEARDLLEEHLVAPDAGAVAEAREGVHVGGHGLATGPGWTVRAPRDADVGARLAEAAEERGGGPAGWRALETRRVEAGVPRVGAEVTGDRFPQEAGLMAGVDLEKGCFVGQETVARIANRGQVNWQVVQVKAADPLRQGQTLKSAGEVGEVTSGAPEARPPRALALVRTEVAEEGARLASPAGPVDVVEAASWDRDLETPE